MAEGCERHGSDSRTDTYPNTMSSPYFTGPLVEGGAGTFSWPSENIAAGGGGRVEDWTAVTRGVWP